MWRVFLPADLLRRVIESTESPEVQNKKDDSEHDSGSVFESETDAESGDQDASSSERRITRANTMKSRKLADFSQLTASRRRKSDKLRRADSKDTLQSAHTSGKRRYKSSIDSKEEYIDSLVERIRRDHNSDESEVTTMDVRSRRSSVLSRTQNKEKSRKASLERSELSSDSVLSSYSSNKKGNKKKDFKKGVADPTVKNPIKKSSRKAPPPPSVTKDEAEKELQFSREDWLKMDPALGERCLAHLTELEQQRSRCSNISGRVAGRMKESRIIASEISKAMIEKLTTVGDVFSLKNENFSLKEELNELKRREKAQSKEIDSLRRMISNLEREVVGRSLKDGFGPFPALKKTSRRSSTPEKKSEKRRGKITANLPMQEVASMDMEVEPLESNTPGCSKNDEYMNREVTWPEGKDTTPWKDKTDEVKTKVNRDRANRGIDSIYVNSNTNPNMYSNVEDDSMYTNANTKVDTMYTNTNIKEATVNLYDSAKPRIKRIRVVENKQLVPPSRPSYSKTEWTNVDNRDRRKQTYTTNKEAVGSRQRLTGDKNNAAKSGKRLIKPAVVTITSKPGGATYAEILAKARQRVSLGELGIETTTIRRAMNGAIVIQGDSK